MMQQESKPIKKRIWYYVFVILFFSYFIIINYDTLQDMGSDTLQKIVYLTGAAAFSFLLIYVIFRSIIKLLSLLPSLGNSSSRFLSR